MKIAFILSGLSAGGAERVIALVSHHWVEQGHQVSIITFDHPDDPIFHPLHPSIELVRLGLPPGKSSSLAAARLMAERVRRLRNALRRIRPDTIMSFLFKINVLALIASRGLGIPVAVSERNHPRAQKAHPLWRKLGALTYPSARLLILQTEDSRHTLAPDLRERGIVIPNPITRLQRNPEPEGPKILAAVGRMEQQKGFDMLLDAFARIESRHPDWTLTIWGEGPERGALETQARTLGIEKRLRMPGLSKGPADWISQASAYVLSSRFEGFCNVLGEAGAAGLPRVSFACEFGPTLLVQHEEDGLLVPPEDVPTLANALDRLLGDRDLRERLGARAAQRAHRFSEENILRLWDEILPRLA